MCNYLRCNMKSRLNCDQSKNFSTLRMLLAETLYCLPPVSITAKDIK